MTCSATVRAPPLRPRDRARRRPDGRPPGLAVRGHQRLRHPRDRAGRHRPRRGRAALQRRPGPSTGGSATTSMPDCTASDEAVPVCPAAGALRGRSRRSRSTADVNQAYDNLGATSRRVSAELAGIDLTDAHRRTPVPAPKARCAVLPCAGADRRRRLCPYANAFWDGTQMVFGAGLRRRRRRGRPRAHPRLRRAHLGPVLPAPERGASTSRSPTRSARSSTTGIRRRRPATPTGRSARTWTEVGALRSLKDPPRLRPARQDDRATAANAGDVYDDNGAVHPNDGVGNKTAYLISQGGTFNGRDRHRHRRR